VTALEKKTVALTAVILGGKKQMGREKADVLRANIGNNGLTGKSDG
jgi:hypothetical protein